MSGIAKIICSQCREEFEWEQAYQHQITSGFASKQPKGKKSFHPSVYCPYCGFLIAEWKNDQDRDNEEWIWFGENAMINAGKSPPPSPSNMWGKVLPADSVPAVGVHQVDLKKLAAMPAKAAMEEQLIGYCSQCHAVRLADTERHCLKCGTVLLDVHVGKIAPVKAPQPVANYSPPRASPPAKSAKPLAVFFRFVAVLILIMAGFYFVSQRFLLRPATLQPTATAQAASVPSPTTRPAPTRTPARMPTKTPIPLPVEVTFDEIGQYEVGRLVILTGRLALMGSTRCSDTCGLLLENIANPSQTITIYVDLATGENTPLPNQMKPLPASYRKSDIQVRTADGTYVAVGFRLRITGEVCRTTKGDLCVTNLSKIELVQVK